MANTPTVHVLDHADPAGQHAVIRQVLEPLEHSVLDTALDDQPMEGIPVLEPLEHSVLKKTLAGGPFEKMVAWEPLAHSVLNITLDGRFMEGIPDLEPLEHSVLMMALDSGITEVMSHLEPLEHSVLNAARDGRPMRETPVLERLEHSVLDMTQDSRSLDMYDYLEDSDWDDPYALASAAYVEDYNFDVPEGMDLMVHRHSPDPDSLDVQQDCQTDVAPVCHTVSYVTQDEWDSIDDDSLAEAADADGPNMGEFYQRVVSSDDEDFVISDNGSIVNLDRDISDEDDCCDSDDRDMSEEEDFVTSDDGSIADLDRDMSDEEDCCDSDVGSVADLEWDTWTDSCTLAFQGAVGAFPPEVAEIRPVVVFRNSLFPRDECANAVVSVRRDVPMSPVLQVTRSGVAMIPPVTD